MGNGKVLGAVIRRTLRIDGIIGIEPLMRLLRIIGRGGKHATVVVDPHGSVGSMTGREDGGITAESEGIDERRAASSHLELVAYGRSGKQARRSTHLAVCHAIDGAQRSSVKPLRAYYIIIIRCSARTDRCHSRSTVNGKKVVACGLIDTPFGQKFLESVGTIERSESLYIISTQLVDGDIDHEAGRRLQPLGRGGS